MVQLVAIPPIHIPSFSRWDPQRKDELFLYVNNHTSTSSRTSSTTTITNREAYRYKLTIIDHPSLTTDVQRTKPIPSRQTTTTTSKHGNQKNRNDGPIKNCIGSTPTTSFTYTNAVFLIPAGRETEYIFSSMSGLRSIVQSANTARLIAVAFGRDYCLIDNDGGGTVGQTPTTTADGGSGIPVVRTKAVTNIDNSNNNTNNMSIELVQDELRYIVQLIASAIPNEMLSNCLTMKQNAPSMTFFPFLALNGIGQRNTIDTGITTCSGRYMIEQCAISSSSSDDDENSNADNHDNNETQQQQQQQWVRRLYFLDGNPNVIQSEVHVSRSRRRQQVAINGGGDGGSSEYDASSNSMADTDVWIVDKSRTAFEYHKSLTAGLLAFLPPCPNPPSSSSVTTYSGLLIGLGGGSLINFWHYIHGDVNTNSWNNHSAVATTNSSSYSKNALWNVTAIELDAAIVQIASKHFGLSVHHPLLNIQIGDGLHVHCANGGTAVAQVDEQEASVNQEVPPPVKLSAHVMNSALAFPKESFDYIVLDVDSKETGAGMSCPPASFVELPYLQTLYALLHPDRGILAINVAARDTLLFHKTCQAVQCVFPSLFLSKRYRNQELTSAIGEGNQRDNDFDTDIEPEDLNVVIFATRSIHGSDAVFSSTLEMTDHVRQWMVSPYDTVEETEERTMLRSDLVECLSEFVLYENGQTESLVSNCRKPSKGINTNRYATKRRQNRRGNNKKR